MEDAQKIIFHVETGNDHNQAIAYYPFEAI